MQSFAATLSAPFHCIDSLYTRGSCTSQVYSWSSAGGHATVSMIAFLSSLHLSPLKAGSPLA